MHARHARLEREDPDRDDFDVDVELPGFVTAVSGTQFSIPGITVQTGILESLNRDPALQDEWVQDARFPAVPGMKRVVKAAKNGGCKVIGLTGRGADQRKATLENLRKYYGDAFRSKLYFTKWADGEQPPYVTCEVTEECTRVEFKSQTRADAEKKFKVKIIANFGDQFSDLIGGHGKPVKLPNPTYYLP